jgi:hypothetical protein
MWYNDTLMRLMLVSLLACAVAVAASGCGSSSSPEPAAAPAPATTTPSRSCPGARQDWRTVWRDIATIRAGVRADNLKQVDHGTSLFLDHLDASKAISLRAKNRLIDHAAAAASAGGCDQCFQQLEASRPIPALAHGMKFAC